MSPRLRLAIPVLLVVGVVVTGALLSGGLGGILGPPASTSAVPGSSTEPDGSAPLEPTIAASPTPRPPVGGTELYGYVPYWEMSGASAFYLRSVPLTTIALFSVSARRDGTINTRPTGYDRITGPIGRRIVREAHARDVRVELVFSSFGAGKNATFFGRKPIGQGTDSSPMPSESPASVPSPALGTPPPPPWHRTVDELVELAIDLDVDGINVDVERLDELDRDAYGEFLSTLRARLVEVRPKARVSVATEAGLTGVGNAAAAAAAGVDRVFLMGYDYHWSGSQPGASSPVERTDGLYDLRWSIDRYVEAGVPRDRILLGLPLYGMTWRTAAPVRTAPVLDKGEAWILRRNLDVLLDPAFSPDRDALEVAEFIIEPDGDGWRLTYYDSPATLRSKLGLARDHGLAGGGFWAIGYERGLPGYLELMADFRDGKVHRSEAPAQEAPPQ